MTKRLKQFIQENKDLINQNSKESWAKIYDKSPGFIIIGEFTTTMLSVGIDPAAIIGHIPKGYLHGSNITDYKIPDSITSISYDAFSVCYNLTSIEIPDGVTWIGSDAFSHCSSLISIIIPDSVTSIGDGAFYGCRNLKEIQYKGTKKQALTNLKVKNKRWRRDSSIQRIVCTDGMIEL